ncbi:hypothetical protein BRADI_4g05458v3 [Brachypodium distachyon]|uniref:Uncharacterized protein n=1 Tax=Brachypodium distachyon TaxID=15368 RepID=A0A2K2CKM5_BRADI|nr:hypothetical protein BRADI_4g05458v3 [Brachypodium distachyon]
MEFKSAVIKHKCSERLMKHEHPEFQVLKTQHYTLCMGMEGIGTDDGRICIQRCNTRPQRIPSSPFLFLVRSWLPSPLQVVVNSTVMCAPNQLSSPRDGRNHTTKKLSPSH